MKFRKDFILKNKNSILIPNTDEKIERPVFMVPVSAGFPSPAEDYVEGSLDLNRHLIKHPAATFFVRVSGNSMVNAGIYPGDILIVDRSLEAVNNKIVIAVLNGELTVKRLKLKNSEIYLFPENPDYSPIKIEENSDFEIWGVATNVIHSL